MKNNGSKSSIIPSLENGIIIIIYTTFIMLFHFSISFYLLTLCTVFLSFSSLSVGSAMPKRTS